MHSDGLIDVLSTKIETWLKGKGNTMRTLASMSDVDYHTIRRIVMKEFGRLSSDRALRILKVITDEDDVIRTMNRFYYGTGDYLIGLDPAKRRLLEEIAGNIHSFKIFSLCDTRAGMKRSQIAEKHGAEGLKILDRLIDRKFLSECDGTVIGTGRQWMPDGWLSMRKMSLFCLELLKDDDFEKGQAMISLQTESLNDEGIKKLIELKANTAKAEAEIIKDPENAGPIPVFSISTLGTFI